MRNQPEVVILTCSMKKDIELFELLARSFDECAGKEVRHMVVVPRREIHLFRRFSSPQRDILAQEDVIPFRIFKLPGFLKHLEPIASGFRRPLYISPELKIIRGWILQQIIKIEVSRKFNGKAIVHTDSDVFFFRDITPESFLKSESPRFFRVEGKTSNPMHSIWMEACSRILGVNVPSDYHAHYVENCVVWNPSLVRDMVERIERNHKDKWYNVILREKTLSEYYIYGVHSDLCVGRNPKTETGTSITKSYWPPKDKEEFDLDGLYRGLKSEQKAFAVQSTFPLSIEERYKIFKEARATKGLH